GPGALTKIESATLTIMGVCTYTGGTTVLGGTLEVNGSLTASPITVNNSATLAGNGTLRAVILNDSATLSPGLATLVPQGEITTGNLTFTPPLPFLFRPRPP